MSERTITVQPGDSLYLIAKREYGDGNRWPDIWHRNAETITAAQRQNAAARAKRMAGPDWIFPGTILVLP